MPEHADPPPLVTDGPSVTGGLPLAVAGVA